MSSRPPDTAVIGSGETATDAEAGARIDEFKRVFRFKGYEEVDESAMAPYVGTRTTHLCANTNIHTVRDLRRRRICGEFEDIEGFYITHTRDMALRRGLRIVRPYLPSVEVCDYTDVRRHARRYVYDAGLDVELSKDLSSGMILLVKLTLMSRGARPVAVHGFDALSEGEVEPRHYWSDESININRLHDLEAEGRVIEQMERDDHVVQISDLI